MLHCSNINYHYSDVTWMSWHVKSLAFDCLFNRLLELTKKLKLCITDCLQSTNDPRIPIPKGQKYGKYFHVMTSSSIHIHFRLGCCPCPIQWGWHVTSVEALNEYKICQDFANIHHPVCWCPNDMGIGPVCMVILLPSWKGLNMGN